MNKNKKKILLEQSMGIYDALPKKEYDEEAAEDALLGHGPIDPGPQMAVQLSVAEPPVEDEDYTPVTHDALANAASAISRAVPNDEIKWFYQQLHKLVDDANDRSLQNSGEQALEDEEVEVTEEEVEVQEESVKKSIRKALYEMLSSDDIDEFDRYRSGSTEIDYFGEDELPVSTSTAPSDEAVSLEDMAAEFGYSGAPGMRQEIQRITDRMEYFSNNIRKEDLNALLDYAAGEYIDTLESADVLDDEDLQDLRSAPSLVKDLDTFRFFFVGAFVLPAYKELARESMKKVKQGIAELDLPKGLDQTVLNQVTGGAQQNPKAIRKKIEKLLKSGELKMEEVEEMARKISSSMPALRQAAELSDDLVERSLEKWQAMSKKKRLSLLNQAMDNTGA